MSGVRSSGFLGFCGIVGGVAIAVGLPWIVLVHGGDLSPGWRVAIIVLALAGGAVLAIASAVVGITIPTAIHGGKLDLGRYADSCCRPESEKREPVGGEG